MAPDTAATDDDERPATAGDWAAALHLAVITTPVGEPYAWVNSDVAMELVRFLREIDKGHDDG